MNDTSASCLVARSVTPWPFVPVVASTEEAVLRCKRMGEIEHVVCEPRNGDVVQVAYRGRSSVEVINGLVGGVGYLNKEEVKYMVESGGELYEIHCNTERNTGMITVRDSDGSKDRTIIRSKVLCRNGNRADPGLEEGDYVQVADMGIKTQVLTVNEGIVKTTSGITAPVERVNKVGEEDLMGSLIE